jgi:hypothetical protein
MLRVVRTTTASTSDSGGPAGRSGLDLSPGRVQRLVLRAARGCLATVALVAAFAMFTTPVSAAMFIQQGEPLVGATEAERFNCDVGKSVALSADGDTALVYDCGAVLVFTRSGTTWTQQAKLTGSGQSGFAGFGESGVALSSDGNTALIGGFKDNESVGAVWVFTRSGATWTQRAKLTGGGENGKGGFGSAVALSSNGNTALIGGLKDNESVGAVWVFKRSGTTWTQQAKLTGGGEIGKGSFGAGVALSSNGKTGLIGAPADNNHLGAAWVFTRSGKAWAQQGGKLTGGGEIGNGSFGASVALSGDGRTALIGGPEDAGNTHVYARGAAWVFMHSGNAWTQQGDKFTRERGYDLEDAPGGFGSSVALSVHGSTALVGDPRVYYNAGATSVLMRSGTTWTVQGELSRSGGQGGHGEFGHSVGLSSDGSTALIGNPTFDHFYGLAWVFVNVNPPVVTKVSPHLGPAIGGTSVTIRGTNFNEATAVKFGSADATSFKVNSARSITAVAPAGVAGIVDVTVTTPGGVSPISSKDAYTFVPTVTNLSPNTGYKAGGTSVTVTGSGFSLGAFATTIKFGSTPASTVNCASTTTCTVLAPAHKAGTLDVKATVNEVSSAKNRPGDRFRYTRRAAPPENVEPPMISGTAKDGQTLAASPGKWSGTSPLTYAFEWQRCDSTGSNCAAISLATAQTYNAVPADVGSTLRVVVTAENVAAEASSTSLATLVVAPLACSNTELPKISGTTKDGQILTAIPNAPCGIPPFTLSYEWQRCDSAGANCLAIPTATNATYTLGHGDVGATLRVAVTAENAFGSSSPNVSTQTAAVAPLAPENTEPPKISGTAKDGQTLSASSGSWLGTPPITFSYQWLRCDKRGENCSPISEATSQYYKAVAADARQIIRVRVTAKNEGGFSSAISSLTNTITYPAPEALEPPKISGAAEHGQMLSASPGEWAFEPEVFTYQWLRCESSATKCEPISGATNPTYVLAAADVGHVIDVEVTASNSGGASLATSSPTAIIT